MEIKSNCKPEVNMIGLSFNNNYFVTDTATITDSDEASKTGIYRFQQKIYYQPKTAPYITSNPIKISFKVSVTSAILHYVSGTLDLIGINSMNDLIGNADNQLALKKALQIMW